MAVFSGIDNLINGDKKRAHEMEMKELDHKQEAEYMASMERQHMRTNETNQMLFASVADEGAESDDLFMTLSGGGTPSADGGDASTPPTAAVAASSVGRSEDPGHAAGIYTPPASAGSGPSVEPSPQSDGGGGLGGLLGGLLGEGGLLGGALASHPAISILDKLLGGDGGSGGEKKEPATVDDLVNMIVDEVLDRLGLGGDDASEAPSKSEGPSEAPSKSADPLEASSKSAAPPAGPEEAGGSTPAESLEYALGSIGDILKDLLLGKEEPTTNAPEEGDGTGATSKAGDKGFNPAPAMDNLTDKIGSMVDEGILTEAEGGRLLGQMDEKVSDGGDLAGEFATMNSNLDKLSSISSKADEFKGAVGEKVESGDIDADSGELAAGSVDGLVQIAKESVLDPSAQAKGQEGVTDAELLDGIDDSLDVALEGEEGDQGQSNPMGDMSQGESIKAEKMAKLDWG